MPHVRHCQKARESITANLADRLPEHHHRSMQARTKCRAHFCRAARTAKAGETMVVQRSHPRPHLRLVGPQIRLRTAPRRRVRGCTAGKRHLRYQSLSSKWVASVVPNDCSSTLSPVESSFGPLEVRCAQSDNRSTCRYRVERSTFNAHVSMHVELTQCVAQRRSQSHSKTLRRSTYFNQRPWPIVRVGVRLAMRSEPSSNAETR
jgi:hypothetical protein